MENPSSGLTTGDGLSGVSKRAGIMLKYQRETCQKGRDKHMAQNQTFPWDDWEAEALSRGVNPKLATLGRAVIREHYQHDWDKFGSEVGVEAGPTMIELAFKQPEKAKKRWQHLLDTDGERVRIMTDGTILDYHTGRKM